MVWSKYNIYTGLSIAAIRYEKRKVKRLELAKSIMEAMKV